MSAREDTSPATKGDVDLIRSDIQKVAESTNKNVEDLAGSIHDLSNMIARRFDRVDLRMNETLGFVLQHENRIKQLEDPVQSK